MYTIFDCIFGDFPAKNTVYAPYVYMVMANPTNNTYARKHTHTYSHIQGVRQGFTEYAYLRGVALPGVWPRADMGVPSTDARDLGASWIWLRGVPKGGTRCK
jgi:hypothetical protein